MSGTAAHGGVYPYGGSFLVFSDYARPSIRLAALSKFGSMFVFTHDSVGLGEDGPTHQPIEHLMALRAIPELTLIRPADGNETAMAWKVAIENEQPTLLALSVTLGGLWLLFRRDLQVGFSRKQVGGTAKNTPGFRITVVGLLLLAIFIGYPVVYSIVRSLFDRSGSSFVGFHNYVSVFTDPNTRIALRNNLDAVWTVEPWVSRIELEAAGKILIDEKDAVITILVARARFLAAHRDLVRRL